MQFSLLDLEKNNTCDGMNFTHLTWLILLHDLVKSETPKMHVNTNSAFNVNYRIAIKCTKLQWQFQKCSDEPHNNFIDYVLSNSNSVAWPQSCNKLLLHNTNKQFCNMCSKCPPLARIHDLRLSHHWSIAASITFCSKSTQVCDKHLCRS